MADSSSKARLVQRAWLALALLLVLLVGVLDYATGPEISVTLFYLLPIFLASWKLGLSSGVLITVLSTVAWFLADWVWEAPYSNPWIPYWNGMMRFGVFLTGVVLIDRTKRLHESLRRLSGLLLQAQEAERRRVARELHDGVNQLLSSVAFRVEAMIEGLRASNQPISEEIGKVRGLLQRAIREVRSISENLRPSELDELGLVAALRDLCQDFNERGPMTVELKAPPSAERFGGEIELSLYRIAQEALTNAAKHAGASTAALRLNWDEESISLMLNDDGKGFGSAKPGPDPVPTRPGMGLIDMRERCIALGGTFSVRSTPGQGTEITVRLPRKAAPGRVLDKGETDGRHLEN